MKTLLTLIAIAAGCAQAQDSPHDVQIVRAIYDKFVLAYRMTALFNQLHQTPSPDPPQYELSSIKSGAVSEILSLPLVGLQTKPATPVLSAGTAVQTLNLENGTSYRTIGATAQWGTAGNPPEDWNVPMARWFAMTGFSDYPRYVSLDVTLSFDGRQRGYKALFLFKQDASGETKVIVGDLITGSVLNSLLETKMVPGALLHYRDKPAVQEFFATAPIPNCVAEPVTKMCCDAASGRCGIDPHVLR